MSLVYKKLPYIHPLKIFAKVASLPGTVFLDSSQEHKCYGRYSFIGIDPQSIIAPNDEASLQEQLDQFEQFSLCSEDSGLPPFTGGLMGYISYDYESLLESGSPLGYADNAFNVPGYWFGVFNQVFAFDNQDMVCYLLISRLSGIDSQLLLDKLEDIYIQAINDPELEIIKPHHVQVKSNFTQREYITAAKLAIDYIKAGDIFEVNLAQEFSADIPKLYDRLELYHYLRYKNPAPFAAYIGLDNLQILSASPERFLQIINKNAEVRPIKGTIKRDENTTIDSLLASQLQSSTKDRAENIMIVDLMRNDLSKICEATSVTVSQLCGLESFTNVHHLVSVINGQIRDNVTLFDIIKAVSPAGSITGAPKIRAQQIIKELEKNTPRCVSYGNIGYIGFNGNIDLSVAIRTVTIFQDKLSFHVGGAITLNSNPVFEYEETLLKGQKIFESLG